MIPGGTPGAAERMLSHQEVLTQAGFGEVEQYDFPTVHDGLRGMQFIYKAVESCKNGSTWEKMQ